MITHSIKKKNMLLPILLLSMLSISSLPLITDQGSSEPLTIDPGPKNFSDLEFDDLGSLGYRPRFAYPGADFIQAPEPIPEGAIHHPVGVLSSTMDTSPTRATWDTYYEDDILRVFVDVSSSGGGDLSSNEEQLLDRIISDFVNYSFPRVKDYFDPQDVVSDVDFYVHQIDGYSGTGGYYQPTTDEFHVDRADLSWAGPITAHEFQHYVHRQYDTYENLWVDEGTADYAAYLVYGISSVTASHLAAYLEDKKDFGLVVSDNTFYNDRSTAYYGVAYLFQLYMTHQYGGKNWTNALVQQTQRGINGMNRALSVLGTGKDFDDVFADWLVATRFNDVNLGEGQFVYGERNYPYGTINIDLTQTHSGTPVTATRDINAYSNTVIRFSSPKTGADGHRLKLTFDRGSPFVAMYKERSGNTQVDFLQGSNGYVEHDFDKWGNNYNSFQLMISSSSSTSVTYSVDVLDLHPPDTSFRISPLLPDGSDGWYVTSPKVTLESSEPTGDTFYRINGGETQEYVSPFYITDGIYNITFWSKDRHGNRESNAYFDLKVDTMKPTSSIEVDPALPEDQWYSSPPTVTLSTSHSNSKVFYRFNNDDYSEYLDDIVPPEGQSVLHWMAVDQAGNEEDPQSRTFRIDTVPPHIYHSLYPEQPDGENGWYISHPVLTLNTPDAEMIYYAFGSGELQVYTAPITIPEGISEIRFLCVDKAGNLGNESRLDFKVDTTEPTIAGDFEGFDYTAQNSSLWLNFPPMLEIIPSEKDMVINYSINGDEPVPYTIRFEIPEGDNEIWVHAKDRAGNTATSLYYVVKVDKRSPHIEHSFTSNSENGWFTTGNVKLELNPKGEDERSSVIKVYYRWGAEDDSLYKGPLSIPEGSNTLYYWAEDLAGNEMEPRTVDVKKDSTQPMIYLSVDGLDDGSVDQGINFTVDISGSSDESGIVAFGFDFDGSGIKWSNENVVEHFYPEPGNYTVTVYVRDAAGNIVQESFDVRVDRVSGPVKEVVVSSNDGRTTATVLVGAFLVILIIIAVVLVVIVKRRQEKQAVHQTPMPMHAVSQNGIMKTGALGNGGRSQVTSPPPHPRLPVPPRPPLPPGS